MAVLVSRIDVPGVPDAVTTTAAEPLGSGPLSPVDVHGVRFDIALRGYRAEQVDGALERLAAELGERDAEIARLREERDRRDVDGIQRTGGIA
ncbi:DivIVA domain-containing protein [Ornithinimicrobium pratense]|uniref:DivIVA domain-containing protein n=2 Tax=Ornithinimicrobium pratense TaxID=2593973 RepID=A0A5J6V8W0_9MICO|nr:DivIVA domain-containing protein [Ornithinimicrobium pratense]